MSTLLHEHINVSWEGRTFIFRRKGHGEGRAERKVETRILALMKRSSKSLGRCAFRLEDLTPTEIASIAAEEARPDSRREP
jgi:hypothetical protein